MIEKGTSVRSRGSVAAGANEGAIGGSKWLLLAIASILSVVGLVLLLLLLPLYEPFSEKIMRVETMQVSLQLPGRPAAVVNQSTPPVECLCEGENLCFPGLDEKGAVRWGRRFDCGLLGALRDARLTDAEAARTPSDAARITATDQWDPVFVTATSSNHFSELRLLIRLLHGLYPKSRIVVVDIGLESEQVEEAAAWCNAEVHAFDFGRYPPHVKNPLTYAFKLAIVETLAVHKTFFWFDTSVRPAGHHLVEFLRGVQSGHLPPFSTHTARTHHSVFASTDPGMFTYLPLPQLVSQLTEMESSFQFVSDAPYTRYVFKWWLLCAMTRECIAPKGAQIYCRTGEHKDKYRSYMNCHRFDQSYWSIAALAQLFGVERGAVQFGYAANWTELSEDLVAQVEQKRLDTMRKYENLTALERGDVVKEKLQIVCL